MIAQNQNRKQTIISRMYTLCLERGNLTFNNNEVREIATELRFRNYFDATKIDRSGALPPILRQNDMFVVHLGQGLHRFVPGIATGYHEFEPIAEERCHQWRYRRSILNNINTSESNILSVGYNQRILHDFLYADITASPRLYGSNRTQIPLIYRIGDVNINADRVQVEIDMTLEYQGEITAFEAKNGNPTDFNVFQLFNPFRYYRQATEGLETVSIKCCYLLRRVNRLRLYLYSFPDQANPGSIQLERNAEYTLVQR
jgi:hypothetical protein